MTPTAAAKPLLDIRETGLQDLANIQELWNDGQVMKYVGFPAGLGITIAQLEEWLPWAIAKPQRCHYSIYQNEIGYCGETFYDVNPTTGTAVLDIKLLPKARGYGIATQALNFAIDKAFKTGGAERVYVDPHPDNQKA